MGGVRVMQAQFSLAHLTALPYSPPELVGLAHRAGYDFVSLRIIPLGLPDEPDYSLTQNKALLKETKKALDATGVKLLDIEVARIYDGLDPQQYLPAFEAAAELGGRHVLSSIWTDDLPKAIDLFARVCELAKPFGLTVELEFVPIASIHNLAGALQVLQAANQENAGLLIDTHHFHRAQEKVEDLHKVPRQWFRFVQLCDAPGEIPSSKEEMTRILREERLYVGEGGIDLAGIIVNIPEVPYSLEIPHVKRCQTEGYEEHVKRCLQSAKAYLSKIKNDVEKRSRNGEIRNDSQKLWAFNGN